MGPGADLGDRRSPKFQKKFNQGIDLGFSVGRMRPTSRVKGD
ncbi:hypothetical protein PA257_2202 [Pseudomonas aeruginosa]|nr:hypothetical protein PA257_2202 [Pseudomonas aeruginosa]